MLKELSKRTTISSITWAANDINEFLNGFLDVMKYNGYSYYLKKFKRYINENKSKEIYSIDYPSHILKGDADSVPGILWSMLVMMFGDYGTSPRFGWLEIKRIDECLYFLDWFIELFEDKEGE